MAEDTGFKVISRAKKPEADTGFKVLSRTVPKTVDLLPDGTPRVPVDGTTPAAPPQPRRMVDTQYGQLISNAMGDMREGASRVVAPGASLWERTKGAGQAALGGLSYASAPAEYVARKVVGDPVQNLTGSETAGDVVSIISEMVTGGAAPKIARAVPGMVKEGGRLIEKAAPVAGDVFRSAVDTVEDLVKSRAATVERKAAEKAANVAPTKDSLYGEAGTAFERAKTVGGELKPDVFNAKVGKLREKLAASDISLSDDPELFKNTQDMLKALETRGEAGSVGTFAALMKTSRALRGYVRKAKAAGVREGDDSDYRAAAMLKREVDDFIKKLTPEDMAGGDPAKANEALTSAKDMYRRASKMDDVEDIIKKAERTNNPDYLQKEFEDILLDDYAFNNFTKAEQELIKKIGANTNLENVGKEVLGGKKLRAVGAAIGTQGYRMKLAKELMDMIARGEGAQAAKAAEQAAKPSFFSQVEKQLRPGPPNSANRGFPYSNPSEAAPSGDAAGDIMRGMRGKAAGGFDPPSEPVKPNWSSGDWLSTNPSNDLGYTSKHVYGPGGGPASFKDPFTGDKTTYPWVKLGELKTKSGVPLTVGKQSSGDREIALWTQRKYLPDHKPGDDNLWVIVGSAKQSKGALEHLAVSPYFQREGLGQQLIGLAEKHLKANPYTGKDFSEKGAGAVNKYREAQLRAKGKK